MPPSSTPRRHTQHATSNHRRRTTLDTGRDSAMRSKQLRADENLTPRRNILATSPSKPVRAKPDSAQANVGEHILNRHVLTTLNNSPGGTPKTRNPPKHPTVERNDGLRHMTEAERNSRLSVR
ncbi:unnamed protein product [Parajaminaea phylloscopi]